MNFLMFDIATAAPSLSPDLAGSSQTQTGITISITSILFIAVAIYFIVACIRGKGKLFDTEKIRDESIPAFKRTVRMVLIPISLLLIAIGVLDSLTDWASTESSYYYVRLVICILTLAAMISITFVTKKYIDPEKDSKPLPTREELKAQAEANKENAEFPPAKVGEDDGSAGRRFYD